MTFGRIVFKPPAASCLYVFSDLLQSGPTDVLGELSSLDFGNALQDSLTDSLGLCGGLD